MVTHDVKTGIYCQSLPSSFGIGELASNFGCGLPKEQSSMKIIFNAVWQTPKQKGPKKKGSKKIWTLIKLAIKVCNVVLKLLEFVFDEGDSA